jgi:hypothetical protein
MADVPEYKELITKINPFFAQHEDLEFFAKWLEAFDTCCEYLALESHMLTNTRTVHDFYYGRKTSWLIINVPSTISTITKDGVEYGINGKVRFKINPEKIPSGELKNEYDKIIIGCLMDFSGVTKGFLEYAREIFRSSH